MCQSNEVFKKGGLKVLKVTKNTDSHRSPPAPTGGKSHRRNSARLSKFQTLGQVGFLRNTSAPQSSSDTAAERRPDGEMRSEEEEEARGP